MVGQPALEQSDVRHHALVRIVVRVEDQPLQGLVGVALGRRDARDDRFEDLRDAGALLGRHQQYLLARNGEHALELLDDEVGLGRGQVDLVDHGHDDQVLGEGEMDVGQCLRLDALRRVDDEDRTLARLERAADLVGKVDVAGRVDQVERVALAVARVVLEVHRAGLDGDAVLALEVHRVEHLAGHQPRVDGVRQLEQPVGERGFAVIDMGNDREVAQSRLGNHREASIPTGTLATDQRADSPQKRL